MEDELSNIVVRVPAVFLGQVLGELNQRGAWLDGMKDEAGISVVQARAPAQGVSNFKQWLKEITGGRGEIVIV
jgi:translation elongation factor EF-G